MSEQSVHAWNNQFLDGGRAALLAGKAKLSPFVWHKTADEIIAKVRRGRAALTHQTKSATDR